MMQSKVRCLAGLCVGLMMNAGFAFAKKDRFDGAQESEPEKIGRKGNAEYYSSTADAKVVIPINIWGEIALPGIHFVAIGTTLTKSISAAGGPTGAASMPEVKLIRGSTMRYVDLINEGNKVELQSYDTIFVDKSFKSELPLIMSVIGTVITLATFALVMQDRKK